MTGATARFEGFERLFTATVTSLFLESSSDPRDGKSIDTRLKRIEEKLEMLMRQRERS